METERRVFTTKISKDAKEEKKKKGYCGLEPPASADRQIRADSRG